MQSVWTRRLLAAALVLAGCSLRYTEDEALDARDAGAVDAGAVDAGAADAGHHPAQCVPTATHDVHIGSCHSLLVANAAKLVPIALGDGAFAAVAVDGDASADGGTLTIIRIDGGPVAGPSAGVPGFLWHEPIDVADLDGDGVSELIAGVGNPYVFRLSASASPSTAAVLQPTLNGLEGIAATRIGVDSRVDVVVADVGGGTAIHGYRQNGPLTFSEPFDYVTSWDDLAILRSADLTGDGHPVPVEALEVDNVGQIRVWSFAAELPTFTAYDLPGSTIPRDLFVADVDGDGNLDVVVWWATGFAVLRGDGTGALGAPAMHAGTDVVALGIGDLDGDCLPDAIRFDSNALRWTPGLPDGGFGDDSEDLELRCPSQPYGQMFVVEMNGDGQADLLASGGDRLIYGFQP